MVLHLKPSPQKMNHWWSVHLTQNSTMKWKRRIQLLTKTSNIWKLKLYKKRVLSQATKYLRANHTFQFLMMKKLRQKNKKLWMLHWKNKTLMTTSLTMKERMNSVEAEFMLGLWLLLAREKCQSQFSLSQQPAVNTNLTPVHTTPLKLSLTTKTSGSILNLTERLTL